MTGVGAWCTRAEYDAWCRSNMVAFNLLTVRDPEAWERAAQKVEDFLARMKKAELVE